jgi:DNA primase
MPKKFDRADIERIRDSHRIEDVAARYTELKPAGRKYLSKSNLVF